MLTSLRLLSNTLTDLDIEYGQNTQPRKRYRLCDILDACPYLVSLRLFRADVDMASVTKTYPKLIKLTLHNHGKMYEGDMASLLHPFPQLHSLDLYPLFRSDSYRAIDQCLPLLQHLLLSGCRPPHFPHIMDTPERPGLRALSITTGHKFGYVRDDDMVEYLMEHSETIEALDITTKGGFGVPKDLLQQTASQQVTFKQLRLRCVWYVDCV